MCKAKLSLLSISGCWYRCFNILGQNETYILYFAPSPSCTKNFQRYWLALPRDEYLLNYNTRVATANQKLYSRTLLGHFPGLFKQWRS